MRNAELRVKNQCKLSQFKRRIRVSKVVSVEPLFKIRNVNKKMVNLYRLTLFQTKIHIQLIVVCLQRLLRNNQLHSLQSRHSQLNYLNSNRSQKKISLILQLNKQLSSRKLQSLRILSLKRKPRLFRMNLTLS